MYKLTKNAVEQARKSREPFLIEAYTYRLGPHTTADDPRRYRELKEVREWEARDPIPRFRRYLERKGFWSKDEDKELWRKLGEYVERTVEKLLEVEPPEIKSILDDVYSKPVWFLEDELEELLDTLKD